MKHWEISCIFVAFFSEFPPMCLYVALWRREFEILRSSKRRWIAWNLYFQGRVGSNLKEQPLLFDVTSRKPSKTFFCALVRAPQTATRVRVAFWPAFSLWWSSTCRLRGIPVPRSTPPRSHTLTLGYDFRSIEALQKKTENSPLLLQRSRNLAHIHF